MVMVGCTRTPTTSNSTTTLETSNPTTEPPSYQGTVSLAKPGEGSADIWGDKYGVYPNVLTVKMGTKVTFTNFDVEKYTVVSDDGLFLGVIEPNGGTWSYLFNDPGYFVYSIDPYNAELCGAVIVLE